MNTNERVSPMANEMSALYDKIEQLEEQNAILLASDAGEMMERNARQAAAIKDLLTENNALRAASETAPTPAVAHAAETSINRKCKRNDPRSDAEVSLDPATREAAEGTNDSVHTQDADTQARKKLKLTAISSAVNADELRERVANEVSLTMGPSPPNQFTLAPELQIEVEKLRNIVRLQDEALSAQSKAGESSKAYLKSEAKHVDSLLQETQRRRVMERKYAKRTDELLHETRRYIAEAAGLDPNAIAELGVDDRSDKENGEHDQIRASNMNSPRSVSGVSARERMDDKGQDKAHAISVYSGSIFEDASVRGLPPGRPKEPETCFVPVRPHLPKDPRVPGKRKPLAELPVEKFRLQHKWTAEDVEDMLVEIAQLEASLVSNEQR